MNFTENPQISTAHWSNDIKFGKLIEQQILFRMTLRSSKSQIYLQGQTQGQAKISK
jgi:hypothetical protein